ncbi:acetyl-CoA synthetase-like protein [Mycena capillaripes]|nr:acetyl-CoA synthetase-like protein [Mycena capillaripes]
MDVVLELNHIALLQDRAKDSGDTILFKLPRLRGSEPSQEWTDITVAEFTAHVERVASHLFTELKAREIPAGSVIGVLLDGFQYLHLVYTIALSRASYVPQMLTDMFTDPGIILELMEKAGAKAVVYDPCLESLTVFPSFPKICLIDIDNMNWDSVLPLVEQLPSGSDVCFNYLTSGSTSGSPKLVPLTQEFVSTFYKAQFAIWLQGKRYDTQNVFLALGSICSVAPMIQYLGCLYTRSCIVQPSKPRVSTEELLIMVNTCGLNHLVLYGTFLSPHIQAAKRDPAILKLLHGMRSISYGGVPVSIAEDDWCFQNGIPLIDLYATTECGLLMSSVPGKPGRFIRPIPTVSCRFDPFMDMAQADDSSPQIFEFILLSDSSQIPKPHLLSADGNFHSGDLFEKQPDGSYLFRGRDDDWIKSEETDRCDAKAIEEKVYETCSDLVENCIVVGNLRPSPALFIEAHSSWTESCDSLKESILHRMKEFNIRRYQTERITDKRLVLVVSRGVLPRTKKGNLRRKAIEQKYSSVLDDIYKRVYNR